MSESATLHARRLLVALDALRCDAGDWGAAMDLAALIGVELQGLFVQDADLLGLASLPIAFEVGRLSGQSRPLARASVESALIRRVERSASALARAGRMRNVTVTHTVARGKLVRQALQQGEQGDVVFLVGSSTRSEHRSARPRERLMLWLDEGPSSQRAIELAAALAARSGAELLIGFPAALEERAAELRARFGALFARAPHAVQLIAFPDAGIDAVLDAARRARITRIVLDAGSRLFSVEAIEKLFASFHGDLIVVR